MRKSGWSKWDYVIAALMGAALAFAMACPGAFGVNGKDGVFAWDWLTPDFATNCSGTVTKSCNDHFEVYRQLGASPSPTTDTLVLSVGMTLSSGIVSTHYTATATNQPAGAQTFYAIAVVRDSTGAAVSSVINPTGDIITVTFRAAPVTGLGGTAQ